MAQDARLADVGRKGRPVAVVVDPLAGSGRSSEKSLGPEILVKAQSSGVTAHDALAQNAAGQQAKPPLLQRNQVALADLGDRGDLFQRNAAG